MKDLKRIQGIKGSWPDFYPESLRVTQKSGAAMMAKSLMCVLKKLHSPTKDLTILIMVGGLASLMACSLFCPGLMPSGVKVKPR